MHAQPPFPELETARLAAIESFAKLLSAEVRLAQNGDGFFEQKYWYDYLTTKYNSQQASNRFYILLHEISK